ncbi:EAL domain-containing protein [Sulfobacillus sp. hq2]|uniref:EAL domain-containing protein n=1 Tax=Sulfobacillus sp. hq2 TaxID=2039167 RepID=UPI001304BCDC|nr:EAL domain-containing protein [Sulfobacillus sp. hq2]
MTTGVAIPEGRNPCQVFAQEGSNVQLYTALQPIKTVNSLAIRGYEVLLRALDPTHNRWISPFTLFNTSHVTDALVLAHHAQQLSRHCYGDIPLFINIEPVTLTHQDALPSALVDIAKQCSERIVVEITERWVKSQDLALWRHKAHTLRDHGLDIALDDWTCTDAGFELVTAIKPHYVKLTLTDIQQHFFHDGRVHSGISSVHGLLSRLQEAHTQIIIEGIETDAQYAWLQHFHIPFAQGYWLGRPVIQPLPMIPQGGA